MPIMFPFCSGATVEPDSKQETPTRRQKDTPMTDMHSTQTPFTRPSVQFDWKDWLPYLEESDLSDEQKQAWIETLWAIVLGFVDLGFEVKSPSETCGEGFDLKAALEAAVLNSTKKEDAHE